jgi:hypothetical protein
MFLTYLCMHTYIHKYLRQVVRLRGRRPEEEAGQGEQGRGPRGVVDRQPPGRGRRPGEGAGLLLALQTGKHFEITCTLIHTHSYRHFHSSRLLPHHSCFHVAHYFMHKIQYLVA